MQSIITLTLNPAIDKSTTVKAIVPDKKLRCATPKFEPGGGGINVSRALKRLGGMSTAVYLAGGYSGKHFQHLLELESIESCVVEIQSHTRENLIVVDESCNTQYRFGMPGPKVEDSEWIQCLDLIKGADNVQFIVASGSIPIGVPANFLGKLAVVAKEKKAMLIVDTSGEPLRHAVSQGVYMLKPNLGELSALHGVDELHEEDAVKAAKEIIAKGGAEILVVSMGASGAMLVTKDEVITSSSPTVKKKSTVGAGDSMVAGMVYALSKEWSWLDVLQYGIATGTATTMNSGTELCKKEDVERLFEAMKSKRQA